MSKLLIVDGNSIAYRAYYALPFLSNHEGNPSGAIYGFANILIKLLEQTRPDYVVVAFDHARKTFRNDIYPEYKMQRKPTPEELLTQLPVIREMTALMGIKVIESAGIEADDIIGTTSKLFEGEKIILSGDRDLLQLIDNSTTVWLTKKGITEVDKVDETRLKELFGLKPFQIVHLKALMGDASDNIPGVKGVGEKTALNLLEKFETVDNLYENINEVQGKTKEKLLMDKDMAFISKTLATIKRDCDIDFNIEDARFSFPLSQKAYDFFKNYDFTSIIKNNNIFEEINDKKEDKKVKRISLNGEILNEMSKLKSGEFFYDLQSLEFLFEGNIYFLEQNYGMFEDGLSLNEIFEKLKHVFEDERVLKVTPNAKFDMGILNKSGIRLINYYDISLAEYIARGALKSAMKQPKLDEAIELKESCDEELKKHDLDEIYYSIEIPLVKILFDMEKAGFKIDKNKLDILSKEFEDKLQSLEQDIYQETGAEFNISSPKQVAEVLFDKLGITAYNNKKRSTNANVLDELRYIPVVDKILNYRKYSKLKNTYIDVYDKLISNGESVLHTTFNQTQTSTGRLSSSEPNLQNIPTRDDEGKVLRKIFVSKFENGKIISADYNQIELRLLADMSGEEKLIEAYKNGVDIHRKTASDIFGVPLEEVTDAERREAKAVNFGIIYGISDYGLSQNIKSTRKKAKDYIDSYFSRYPLVKKFMDDNIEFARDHGYAVTKFGRIRYIPEISSSKFPIRSFGERVAMNMPLQGTASDIIKLAMIHVSQRIEKEHLKSQLILQIHDELIVDTYPGEEKKVETLLREEMENVANLKIPLLVSVGEGENLYDCK